MENISLVSPFPKGKIKIFSSSSSRNLFYPKVAQDSKLIFGPQAP